MYVCITESLRPPVACTTGTVPYRCAYICTSTSKSQKKSGENRDHITVCCVYICGNKSWINSVAVNAYCVRGLQLLVYEAFSC